MAFFTSGLTKLSLAIACCASASVAVRRAGSSEAVSRLPAGVPEATPTLAEPAVVPGDRGELVGLSSFAEYASDVIPPLPTETLPTPLRRSQSSPSIGGRQATLTPLTPLTPLAPPQMSQAPKRSRARPGSRSRSGIGSSGAHTVLPPVPPGTPPQLPMTPATRSSMYLLDGPLKDTNPGRRSFSQSGLRRFERVGKFMVTASRAVQRWKNGGEVVQGEERRAVEKKIKEVKWRSLNGNHPMLGRLECFKVVNTGKVYLACCDTGVPFMHMYEVDLKMQVVTTVPLEEQRQSTFCN